VTLPTAAAADLVALGPKGQIFIVEVKSGVEDFRTDQKWWEYRPYCDAFAFAVAPEFARDPARGARPDRRRRLRRPSCARRRPRRWPARAAKALTLAFREARRPARGGRPGYGAG